MDRRLLRPHTLSPINLSVVCLLSLSILLCVLRLNYYDWPPNRDVTLYAVMGHEFLEGKFLYTDFWDIKPPAIFFSYAVADALFGYGPQTLYILNLICALCVLYGVYAAAAASEYGEAAGAWAGLFWVVLSGDLALQMHDPNTEAFMNAFLIWAFFLFSRSGTRPLGYRQIVLIGFLFAVASLYKQVIIIIPLLLSFGYIASPPSKTSRRQALSHVIVIAGIGILVWILVTIYMAITGRFQVFIDTILTHAMVYAGNPTGNVASAVSYSKLLQSVQRFQVIIPMVLLASAGILWNLIRKPSRNLLMISLYAIGAFLSIALPGKFYRHYFQIGIPPLVVAAAWSATIFYRKGKPWKTLPSRFCVIAVLLFTIAHQVPYYTSPPEVLLKNKYAEMYLVTQKLGRSLASTLKDEETFFQWGAESGLYFFSQRRPPASINGWSHFSRTFGVSFTQQTLSVLKESPPDLVLIVNYFDRIRPDHPIVVWIRDYYIPVEMLAPEESKYYTAMVRRGSNLESRLTRQPP